MRIVWNVWRKDWFPFSLILFYLLTFAVFILTGCKKDVRDLAVVSPSGMVIKVAPETRTATVAARGVYSFVPREFQPVRANVAFKELSDKAIAELSFRDKFNRQATIPYGIKGYTQGPLNNPDENTDTTNIYITPYLQPETTINVAIHEWGHFIYYRYATPDELAEWDSLYAEYATKKELALPGQNNRENFAEFFKLYCAKKAPEKIKVFFDTMKKTKRE